MTFRHVFTDLLSSKYFFNNYPDFYKFLLFYYFYFLKLTYSFINSTSIFNITNYADTHWFIIVEKKFYFINKHI